MESSADLPRGRGELILVVDDEAAVRNVTRDTLESFGYRVLTAEDGAEALAVYAQRKEDIAVVLTDMMMPIMDGSAIVQSLVRMDPQVKIVAASGLSADRMVSKAASTGVQHFLQKPYTAQTLLRVLSGILHRNDFDTGSPSTGVE